MKRVRQRDTAPEIALRKWLWRQGCRFRVHNRRLPGTPDISNSSKRWAIFVNGCFWHGHEGCARATVPKRNREFWVAKIKANRARDRAKQEALERMGFAVAAIWECEIEAVVNGDTALRDLVFLQDCGSLEMLSVASLRGQV
jgi:DNA mismatch endonuclease (patch repair protein)